LEKAGSHTIEDVDGKRRNGKRIIARALWELATTGRTMLPGEPSIKMVASPQEWVDVVQWIYKHIDGPAVQRLSHEGTGEGGAIVVEERYTDAQRVRGLGALFDAIRSGLITADNGGQDAVDAAERPTVGGVPESSG